MPSEAVIGIIALLVTILGGVVRVAFAIGATNSKFESFTAEVHAYIIRADKDNTHIWDEVGRHRDKINGHDRTLGVHKERLEAHSQRLTKLEQE